MSKIKNKKAFTLVELIVVITILAIIGTIAFISLQGYSRQARNSKRIADIQNIRTSLELFILNVGKYPLPDNPGEVSYSGELIRTQGTVGDTVAIKLSKNLPKKPLDPLFEIEYIYSVENGRKEYEVMSIYEGEISQSNSIINPSYAAFNFTTKVEGNYNGIFVSTPKFIVPTPSIINAEFLPVDLKDTPSAINSVVINGGENVPDLGNPTITAKTGAVDMNLSVYPGSIDKNSTPQEKINVIETIQMAYSGSFFENTQPYNNIINTPTEEKENLADTLILGENTKTLTTLISGDCINLPTNATFYGGVTSYSLVDSASSTLDALIAGHIITIIENTCNYKCDSGYKPESNTCVVNTIDTPTSVVSGSQTDTTATVSWDSASGATSYDIYVDGSLYGNTTGTSDTITGLDPDTAYDIYIVGKNDYGEGSASSTITVTTDSSATPSAPTGLTSGSVTDTTADISWNTVSGATSYDIYVNGSLFGNTTGTTETITGLTPNTSNDVYVVGKNASGAGTPSSTISISTVVAAPTSVASGTQGETSFDVSWDAVDGATSYDMYIDGVLYGNTTGTSDTISGLDPDTTYNFYVVGKDSGGTTGTPSSTISVTTSPNVIATPTSVNSASQDEDGFTITWDPASGATSYDMYIDGAFSGNTTSTGVTIDGLLANTSYDFYVVGKNEHGTGDPSATTTITTAPNPPVASSVSSTDEGITVSWGAVTGAVSYEVFVGGVSQGTTTGTSTTVTGLDPNTSYDITVRSIGSSTSQVSTDSNTVTYSTAPDSPSSLTGLSADEDEISISWGIVTGATSYEVFVDGASVHTTTSTGVTLGSLDPNTSYDITVKTIGASPEQVSTASNTLSYKTAPAIPTSLSASSSTESTINISWGAVTGATSYEVLVDGVPIGTAAGTSAVVPGLDPNTSYNITVKAIGDSSSQKSSASTAVTYKTAPSPISSITSLTSTDTSISLEWGAIASATEYEVLVDGVSEKYVSSTGATIDSLTSNTSYTITIRTVGDSRDQKSNGASTTFTTAAAAPNDMTAVHITNDSAQFQWTAVPGADAYGMYAGGSYLYSTVSNYDVVAGLAASSSYNFAIISHDFSGDRVSNMSSNVPVTTAPTTLGSVTGLSLSGATSTSITVKWDYYEDAAYYNAYVHGFYVNTSTGNILTTFQVKDLEPNTTYPISIIPIDGTGGFGVRQTINVSTLP